MELIEKENNQLIHPKVACCGWNQILTASVHSKSKVTNDFHCRNPSSDCPICTMLDVTNKYLQRKEKTLVWQLLTKKTTNANCSSPRSRSSEPPKYFFSWFSSSKVYRDHNNIIKLRKFFCKQLKMISNKIFCYKIYTSTKFTLSRFK